MWCINAKQARLFEKTIGQETGLNPDARFTASHLDQDASQVTSNRLGDAPTKTTLDAEYTCQSRCISAGRNTTQSNESND